VVLGPIRTARSRHGVCEINFVFCYKLEGKNTGVGKSRFTVRMEKDMQVMIITIAKIDIS
jgi:hypothetical protein